MFARPGLILPPPCFTLTTHALFNFLRQPYPPPAHELPGALRNPALVGFMVALLLIIFKPFGTDTSRIPYLNLFLAGYGVVILGTVGLPSVLLPRIFPRLFAEERWTVGRQIVFILFVVFVGLTAAYFYLLSVGGTPRWDDYFYFLRIGFLISVFPVTIIVLLDYVRKLRRYTEGAALINRQRGLVQATPVVGSSPVHAEKVEPADDPTEEYTLDRTPETSTAPRENTVTLTDAQGRPALTLDPATIWCLHADGNYVEVWTTAESSAPERTLIRNTISQLAGQLPPADFLVCHRSWVVNPAHVTEVSGNAQGYRLHAAGGPVVAVARGRSKTVLAALAPGVKK